MNNKYKLLASEGGGDDDVEGECELEISQEEPVPAVTVSLRKLNLFLHNYRVNTPFTSVNKLLNKGRSPP